MAHRKPDADGSSFVTGVAVLTISSLFVKAAGLLFKIPMNTVVGDRGMGYYSSAHAFYTLFYMLSTFGLPVALSVMVSEYRAEGRIAAAAPAMAFICISSALRGYFQGCGNMVPTALSMLCGAAVKLSSGVIPLEKFGIVGAPLSTFLCYLTVTVIHFAFAAGCTGIRLSFRQLFLRPLIASSLCALTAYLTNEGLAVFLPSSAACLPAILTAVLVYAAVVLFTGAVTPDEIRILTGKITRRTGKGNKNEHFGTETEAENRAETRLRVPLPVGGGASERGRLSVGSGADSSLHPHRPDRRDV